MHCSQNWSCDCSAYEVNTNKKLMNRPSVCMALLLLHWFQRRFDFLHIQPLCYCIFQMSALFMQRYKPWCNRGIVPGPLLQLHLCFVFRWRVEETCLGLRPEINPLSLACTSVPTGRHTVCIRENKTANHLLACRPEPRLWSQPPASRALRALLEVVRCYHLRTWSNSAHRQKMLRSVGPMKILNLLRRLSQDQFI